MKKVISPKDALKLLELFSDYDEGLGLEEISPFERLYIRVDAFTKPDILILGTLSTGLLDELKSFDFHVKLEDYGEHINTARRFSAVSSPVTIGETVYRVKIKK